MEIKRATNLQERVNKDNERLRSPIQNVIHTALPQRKNITKQFRKDKTEQTEREETVEPQKHSEQKPDFPLNQIEISGVRFYTSHQLDVTCTAGDI